MLMELIVVMTYVILVILVNIKDKNTVPIAHVVIIC